MPSLLRYMSSTHMPMKQDWKRCIITAAEMGFDGIELFGSEYENESLMEKSLLRGYSQIAEKYRIKLSAHPWFEWDKIPLSQAQAQFKKLLEYCAFMGMEEINIHLAFLSDRALGMDRLFSIVDLEITFLSSHNMTLFFENTPAHGIRELGSEIGDFDSLFEHYGPDSPVMMTIDTGHAQIENITSLLTTKWGTRWKYTHVDDNNGKTDNHWGPGKGVVNWDEFASFVKKAHYSGPLTMEYSFSELEESMPVLIKAFTAQGITIMPLR